MSGKPKVEGALTEAQMGNPGCGFGTENACFALIAGPDGIVCGLLANPSIAQMAGMRLGWRVNVDPTDDQAWCPLEVLDNSKVPPTA